MDQNRTELEKKIVAAGSPEEIERILNDAGEKITAEEAQQLFEKVKSRAADKDYCCPICGAVATPVHRDYDPLPAGFNWGIFCRNHGYILHRYYDDKDIQFGFTL